MIEPVAPRHDPAGGFGQVERRRHRNGAAQSRRAALTEEFEQHVAAERKGDGEQAVLCRRVRQAGKRRRKIGGAAGMVLEAA